MLRPVASLRTPSRPFAPRRVPSHPAASLRTPPRPFKFENGAIRLLKSLYYAIITRYRIYKNHP
jgi:hypothetical protein